VGDGKGNFSASTKTFTVPGALYGPVAVADFNGDGRVDLIMSPGTETNGLVFWTGNGDGTFTMARGFGPPFSGDFNVLAAADFDGDGNLDLIMYSTDTGLLPPSDPVFTGTFLLFGDGKGNFTSSPQAMFPSKFLTVGDFNADGRPDIAALGTDGVSILLGGLAAPAITLTEVPPSPFDFGQTVSLFATVTPDAAAFQTTMPTGNVELMDGANVVSLIPLNGSSAYFVTPFVPRTHFFTATYLGDTRDAAASASLTVIENGPPATISPVSAGFPLQAIVVDANGNPVPGIAVTFRAPLSGPGGLFSGATSATVLTDSRGVATAPVFVANGISGSYAVTATTVIGGISCSFPLSNP
jgi:hypothetical protein